MAPLTSRQRHAAKQLTDWLTRMSSSVSAGAEGVASAAGCGGVSLLLENSRESRLPFGRPEAALL